MSILINLSYNNNMMNNQTNAQNNDLHSVGRLIKLVKMNDGFFGEFSSGEFLQIAVITDRIFRVQIKKEPITTSLIPDDSFKMIKHSTNKFESKFKESEIVETSETFRIPLGRYTLIYKKNPALFAVYDNEKRRMIFQQKAPVSISEKVTTETLQQEPMEFYFGGGMQQAQFSHKGKTIEINADSTANQVPFYWSNSGFGVIANTYTSGKYDFGTTDKSTTILTHQTGNFDNFYCLGDTPTDIFQQYYYLTGNPIMMPKFGFFGMHLAQQIEFNPETLIKSYQKHDLPLGSVMVNEGLKNLKEVSEFARDYQINLGIIVDDLNGTTVKKIGSRDLTALALNIPTKSPQLDLKLVEQAYQMFLDVHPSMRPLILARTSWTASQRFATMQTSNVSTATNVTEMIGAGLSGMPNTFTTQVDLSNSDSVERSVRNYQWTIFSPLQVNENNDQFIQDPVKYGRKALQINRAYLKLRSELIPYIYSLAHQAVNAKPMMRAMFLEFPHEKINYTTNVNTQFMFGPYLLVAPIVDDVTNNANMTVRDGIYLPDARTFWIDYFTGEKYVGGMVYDHLTYENWHSPVFVKSGAIIPTTFAHNSPATANNKRRFFNIYPSGRNSFELIDDDGQTKSYQRNKTARTKIISDLSGTNLTITINKTLGRFEGFNKEQSTILNIFCDEKPGKITAYANHHEIYIPLAESQLQFDQREVGAIYQENFNPSEYFEILNTSKHQQHVLQVKLPKLDITDIKFEVAIEHFRYQSPASRTKIIDSALHTPKNFRINQDEISDYEISLSWQQINHLEKYEIMINDVLHTNINSNHFTFTNLDSATKYQFKIRSTIKNKVSEWSTPIIGQTK